MGWFSKAFKKIGKSTASLLGNTVGNALGTVEGIAGNALQQLPQLAGPGLTALTGLPLGNLFSGGGSTGINSTGFSPPPPVGYPPPDGMSKQTKTILIVGGAVVATGLVVFVATRKK